MIVRVRRVVHLSAQTARDEMAELFRSGPGLDPCRFPPQGFQKGRVLVLCYLADEADDEARAIANTPPPFDFGGHKQVSILEASGDLTTFSDFAWVYWATQPRVKWLIERVLAPDTRDPGEPRSLAMFLLLLFSMLLLFVSIVVLVLCVVFLIASVAAVFLAIAVVAVALLLTAAA